MKSFTVYWYHLETHTDPYKEGYVGVTCQHVVRKKSHMSGKSGGSRILSSAFKKYGEANILHDVLHTVATKEEAYALENQYRPTPCIGWNIAIGGGLPPDCTGRIDPQEVKDRRNASLRAAKHGKTYPSVFKGMTNRHGQEMKDRIGDVHRGKVLSESHKKAFLAATTGERNPNAQDVYLVHIDLPEVVLYFKYIKMASDALGLPYQALRSLVQRTVKSGVSSEPSRTGWICLSPEDAVDPVIAVTRRVEARKERFRLAIAKRELLRVRKGAEVTLSINN